MVVAGIGLIYGTIDYYNYFGLWKTLVMVPLLVLLGYLSVEMCYPMWFGHDR